MTHRFRLATIMSMLLMTSLLTACGFHLRGQMELKSDLTRLAITGSDTGFIHDLSKALSHSGITVVDTAAYRLRVIGLARDTGNETQPTAGRNERQLVLTMTYQLETSDGLALFNPVPLSYSRYISYDQNQVNAAQSEENLVYKELSQELVHTTVRRVAAITQERLDTEVARARKVQQMELEAQQAE